MELGCYHYSFHTMLRFLCEILTSHANPSLIENAQHLDTKTKNFVKCDGVIASKFSKGFSTFITRNEMLLLCSDALPGLCCCRQLFVCRFILAAASELKLKFTCAIAEYSISCLGRMFLGHCPSVLFITTVCFIWLNLSRQYTPIN